MHSERLRVRHEGASALRVREPRRAHWPYPDRFDSAGHGRPLASATASTTASAPRSHASNARRARRLLPRLGDYEIAAIRSGAALRNVRGFRRAPVPPPPLLIHLRGAISGEARRSRSNPGAAARRPHRAQLGPVFRSSRPRVRREHHTERHRTIRQSRRNECLRDAPLPPHDTSQYCADRAVPPVVTPATSMSASLSRAYSSSQQMVACSSVLDTLLRQPARRERLGWLPYIASRMDAGAATADSGMPCRRVSGDATSNDFTTNARVGCVARARGRARCLGDVDCRDVLGWVCGARSVDRARGRRARATASTNRARNSSTRCHPLDAARSRRIGCSASSTAMPVADRRSNRVLRSRRDELLRSDRVGARGRAAATTGGCSAFSAATPPLSHLRRGRDRQTRKLRNHAVGRLRVGTRRRHHRLLRPHRRVVAAVPRQRPRRRGSRTRCRHRGRSPVSLVRALAGHLAGPPRQIWNVRKTAYAAQKKKEKEKEVYAGLPPPPPTPPPSPPPPPHCPKSPGDALPLRISYFSTRPLVAGPVVAELDVARISKYGTRSRPNGKSAP